MPGTLKKLEGDTMSHKWRDVRRTLSPEREDETRRYVRSVVEAATLNQLREARNLTQANLASVLGVNQGSVSKMEKRRDMYVSTLRSFIQAMGGQLQIKAVFPEGEIEIDQFKNVSGSAAYPEQAANESTGALESEERLAS
jgi:transcriptional regulator with XRE-family HTH domain